MKNDEKKFRLAWQMLEQENSKVALSLYASLPWTEAKFNGVVRGLTELGRCKEAGEILDRGLAKFPLSIPLLIGKGNLSLRTEDYLTALKCFETALIVSPQDDSTSRYGKALALENLGQLEQAVTILDSLIQQYPGDSLFITEKAHCLMKMGYPIDALKLYQQAMNIWFQSGEFHNGVAIFTGICSACIDLGLNKEALEIAQNGIKALPIGHPLLYYNAARGYLGMDLVAEAREMLREGLRKFPGDADLLELIQEIEDDMDCPSPQGGTEIIFALILLALIARRRIPRK